MPAFFHRRSISSVDRSEWFGVVAAISMATESGASSPQILRSSAAAFRACCEVAGIAVLILDDHFSHRGAFAPGALRLALPFTGVIGFAALPRLH